MTSQGLSETTALLSKNLDSEDFDHLHGYDWETENDEEAAELKTIEELEAATVPEWTVREIFVTFLAFVAVVLAIIVMVAIPLNMFAYDAFNFMGIFVPFYSAFQEQKLTETKVIKKSMNNYRSKMQQISMENEEIEQKTKELNESAEKLNLLYDILTDLQEIEGNTIDQLEESLVVKKEILKVDDSNVATRTIDNVISILLKVDADQNMVLSEDETNLVIDTLEGIHHMKLKRDFIYKKVKEYGNDLNGVMKLINDIFDDDPNNNFEDYKEE